VNVIGKVVLTFYIFKSECMWEDSNQNVHTMYLHGNANEGVDDNLPFFQFFGFFQKNSLR